MSKIDSPASLIELIEKQVDPLDPPVKSFEKSIRSSPFRILISVLISSRTKDEVTKSASERLFSIADKPEDILKLGADRVSELIYPVGFFRQKGRNIVKIAEKLIENGGKVPSDLNSLVSLPGVGRKTANLVLSLAFNIPTISVDIHVFRISKRIGWANGGVPEIVENELKKVFPETLWRRVNQTLVGFGQTICKPVNPLCSVCSISTQCRDFNSRNSARDT